MLNFQQLHHHAKYSGTSVMGTLMGLGKSVPFSKVVDFSWNKKERIFYEKCIADTHNLFINYMQWIKYYYNLHISRKISHWKMVHYLHKMCKKYNPHADFNPLDSLTIKHLISGSNFIIDLFNLLFCLLYTSDAADE